LLLGKCALTEDGGRSWVGGRIIQTFGGVDFSRVLVAGKVQEGLNEFERTRLEARKVDGHCGWARKLSRGGIAKRFGSVTFSRVLESAALSFRGSLWLEQLKNN
jgi:hypothetical protein